MNILFIMYDQLRHDYLSCAGHPHLQTPNMDRLAARGLRFTNAYVQSPVCGASRMSFYTGRYMSSHGATWNNVPLKVGEQTLGDHLRRCGMRSWLIGKTHMKADADGMDRLGIAHDGVIGTRLGEAGFDTWVRDDGLWAEGPAGPYDGRRSPYNAYLAARGYGGTNPWHDHANSSVDADGNTASGFLMRHAGKPAHVHEPDSETAWLTDRAIDFLDSDAANSRWLAHLSYIKPHWPYIVPAPYHALYNADHVPPVMRDTAERQDPHPVFGAFMDGDISRSFHDPKVRDTIIPAYMGLIKQCDDHLGRLLDHLEATGRDRDTMIVLTSDHGDYLGDHWMGEKDLFHAPSVKVPLIIVDPRPNADATRGRTCDALVEAIDLAPTFVEVAGGTPPDHILEGRSLRPWLYGETPDKWRTAAISEYDYGATEVADQLGQAPRDCRLFMVATKEWKLMAAAGFERVMLFDLVTDPDELHDLGTDPAHADKVQEMMDLLNRWSRRMSQRTTISEDAMRARRGGADRVGILIGVWDEAGVPQDTLDIYSGPARPLPDA
ncbi:sulfatase-like hydrolase/transferase [Oceanomicrobium pacificus]|uniref:Sulfatase-like hydrolase/transferase n=1 Tax=Oceanomicrobium pacificus TaxID=2692916 RepID=A0A6B0TL15_9RHOB|nr:sulfatase-like hydrolase/transferase [Oceanomicrobium pacificus]MXU65187.1 sulfatase-like hydrolase/transferase [Oceanomicrobium pacificus]